MCGWHGVADGDDGAINGIGMAGHEKDEIYGQTVLHTERVKVFIIVVL